MIEGQGYNEVVCSDVDEHKRRVESRTADITGHILPTWSDVTTRDYHPWDRERLVIDIAHTDVDHSVQAILSAVLSA